MDVHINNGGCYLYEDNNMVGASFKFQTKENLSEDYAGSNWLYTIVNDSLIEKTMAAGGNTYYFIKKLQRFVSLGGISRFPKFNHNLVDFTSSRRFVYFKDL